MTLKNIKKLIKIANQADLDGNYKKADEIDRQIIKLSGRRRKTNPERSERFKFLKDRAKKRKKRKEHMDRAFMNQYSKENLFPEFPPDREKSIKEMGGEEELFSDYSRELERAFQEGRRPVGKRNLGAEERLKSRRQLERMFEPTEDDFEVPDLSGFKEDFPTAEVYYDPEPGDGLEFLLDDDSEEKVSRSIFDVPDLPIS